jgi:hypothetical protein
MNAKSTFNDLYYQMKPYIPRWLQIWVRRMVVKCKRLQHTDKWPILETAGQKPPQWRGWPDNKRIAVVLTHDVESRQGVDDCLKLARMELELGFRSSFNFVAKRYEMPDALLTELTQMGFEIGVHGVYHDGKLFKAREIFQERARIINQYLKKWGSVGFRAPAMHHNLEWLHELDIAYDLSTFDTDPFEPQSDGVETIFPFWVERSSDNNRYLELPYTLVQDFTLFVLMKETSARLWKNKLDWIAGRGGMALVNTHPDYMAFGSTRPSMETYPVEHYLDLLRYIKSRYAGSYWNALPREMVPFCKTIGDGCPVGA